MALNKKIYSYFLTLYRIFRDYIQYTIGKGSNINGFKFNGSKFMNQGVFEPVETNIACDIFRSVDIVVNIGANFGYYCCLAIKSNKNIIAFEPLNSNLKYLYRNILQNNWQDKIEIYPIALSNKHGIVEIFGSGTSASLLTGWAGTSTLKSKPVPCSTIDLVLFNRLKSLFVFFIVDVEGSENLVLKGAHQMLNANPKPVWLIEINFFQHQPSGRLINPNILATFDEFWKLGYRAYTACKNPRLIEREEVISVINTRIDTILTHNFLFFAENYTYPSGTSKQ